MFNCTTLYRQAHQYIDNSDIPPQPQSLASVLDYLLLVLISSTVWLCSLLGHPTHSYPIENDISIPFDVSMDDLNSVAAEEGEEVQIQLVLETDNESVREMQMVAEQSATDLRAALDEKAEMVRAIWLELEASRAAVAKLEEERNTLLAEQLRGMYIVGC